MSPNHLGCFTSVGWFWGMVVISHPSSDGELCWEGCTAPWHSPPEAKTQNSWVWKSSLQQHLHHQKIIHLTCIRSSFCCAVLLLNIWRPELMLLCSLKDLYGWDWLHLLDPKGRKSQGSINRQHRRYHKRGAWLRCELASLSSLSPEGRSSCVAKCPGSTGAHGVADAYVIQRSVPNAL